MQTDSRVGRYDQLSNAIHHLTIADQEGVEIYDTRHLPGIILYRLYSAAAI